MRKALRKTGILAFILAVYFSLSVAAAQMVSLEGSTAFRCDGECFHHEDFI